MKISILCLNLNGGKFIWKCINSVVSQSHSNWELLIADGGSQDDSLEIINQFNDKRIRILPGSDNSRKEGLEKALKFATGQAIMITTSTDGYIDTDWLKTASETLSADTSLALVWGGWTVLRDEKISFSTGPSSQRHRETPLDLFKNWLNSNELELSYLPELNYCVVKNVYKICLEPNEDYSDINYIDPILNFHFNFMRLGYLSKFIPTIASFGREHDGQFQHSETQKKYLDRYKKSLSSYRSNYLEGKVNHYLRKADGEIFCKVEIMKNNV